MHDLAVEIILKRKLRHIAFFFLTVFVVSQMLHLMHAAEHMFRYNTDCNSDTEQEILGSKSDNHAASLTSKSAHQHHCSICSNFQNQFVDFNFREYANVFIPVFFDDTTSNFYIAFRIPLGSLPGGVELRGPPSFR